MDIRSKAVDPTSTLHLRDANDELMYETVERGGEKVEEPVEVVLFTPASKQYQKAIAARNKRLMERIKRKGKDDMSAEAQVAERAAFLADVTSHFNHVEYGDITEAHAKAKAIYGDIAIGFIADQAESHLKDWANFSKSAPTA